MAGRFEGGTDPVAVRLAALGRLARAGYPVGLTIAPIMPVTAGGKSTERCWTPRPTELSGADLTVECITHRFTPNSKDVLTGWYPRTKLEMEPELRSRKRGKFGAVKYVYPPDEMRVLARGSPRSSSGGCPPPASSTGPDLLRAATRRRRTGRGSASS